MSAIVTHLMDRSMDLRASMLVEYAHESQLTRSLLEVVPDGLLGFKAAEGMHTVRWNVSHLVDIPSWADMILNQGFFDVAPPGEPPHSTPELATMAEAISTFEANVATATNVIETFSLNGLDEPWSLRYGGQAFLTHPRYQIYRMYLVNHVAHHRGHLSVYLRMNQIETPRLYGG